MRIRRRRRYTLALAIAACVLGMLTAIVALTLPFWADLEEDLAAPIALLAATLSATPLLHHLVPSDFLAVRHRDTSFHCYRYDRLRTPRSFAAWNDHS